MASLRSQTFHHTLPFLTNSNPTGVASGLHLYTSWIWAVFIYGSGPETSLSQSIALANGPVYCPRGMCMTMVVHQPKSSCCFRGGAKCICHKQYQGCSNVRGSSDARASGDSHDSPLLTCLLLQLKPYIAWPGVSRGSKNHLSTRERNTIKHNGFSSETSSKVLQGFKWRWKYFLFKGWDGGQGRERELWQEQ